VRAWHPTNTVIEPRIHEFITSDGYRHRYRHWMPQHVRPRGYVVALHGIQSHSGWYVYSSDRLAAAGYDVRFLDRRGSGMNGEARGHAVHSQRLVNDVSQFLGDVRAERAATSSTGPVVLLGASWGGKLAAAVAAQRPELVDALALLYPGIRARFRPSQRQRLLLRLAMAAGVERRQVEIPLQDAELFTDSEEWREFIRRDPLALRAATVGFLQASVELDRLAESALSTIACPVLLMLAGRDRIIDNVAVRAACTRLPSTQLTTIEYPAAAHTLEFEPGRDRFVDDLIGWVGGLSPAP
jgi:acylglycerol lipase